MVCGVNEVKACSGTTDFCLVTLGSSILLFVKMEGTSLVALLLGVVSFLGSPQ